MENIIPNKPGIYKITNKTNERFYIGSSQNLRRRRKAHFKDLKLGTHCNRFLQRSYARDGAENFIFEIIELCNKEECLIKEQALIDQYWDCEPPILYNAIKEVYQEPTIVNGELFQLTRGFLSGSRNHKFGKKNSPELLAALAEASRKTWSNPEHVKFMSESFSGNGNPFYGQKHSQESLKKIKESKIKSGYCKAVTATKISTGEIIYADSNADLARAIGVTKSTINTRTDINHSQYTISPVNGIWKIRLAGDNGEQDILDKLHSDPDTITAENIITFEIIRATNASTLAKKLNCSKSAVWQRLNGRTPITRPINKMWLISLVDNPK